MTDTSDARTAVINAVENALHTLVTEQGDEDDLFFNAEVHMDGLGLTLNDGSFITLTIEVEGCE